MKRVRSSYIDHFAQRSEPGTWAKPVTVCTHSWAEHTAIALRWHYPDRAEAIAAGRDPQTQMDLARWASLGRRDAA